MAVWPLGGPFYCPIALSGSFWIKMLFLVIFVKSEIGDSSQILTTAPIFLQSYCFRQKYLEIASCAVSVLIYCETQLFTDQQLSNQVPQPTCFRKLVGRTNPLKSGISTLKVIFTVKTKSGQPKWGIYGILYARRPSLDHLWKKFPHK